MKKPTGLKGWRISRSVPQQGYESLFIDFLGHDQPWAHEGRSLFHIEWQTDPENANWYAPKVILRHDPYDAVVIMPAALSVLKWVRENTSSYNPQDIVSALDAQGVPRMDVQAFTVGESYWQPVSEWCTQHYFYAVVDGYNHAATIAQTQVEAMPQLLVQLGREMAVFEKWVAQGKVVKQIDPRPTPPPVEEILHSSLWPPRIDGD